MVTTTVPETQPTTHPSPQEVKHYLNESSGIWSWMSTVDHKRIGMMYLVSILFFFFVGGMAAILVRTEHLLGTPTIMSPDIYNHMFTIHGAIMTFLVIIPGLPGAIGNMVLPIQVGAIDVAFPRLNLTSFYLYVIGAIFAILAIILGGFDTGWTFYTPYSTTTPAGGVIPVVAGVFILGFSSILTGLNFIVTIHKMRQPGMGWFDMPLFLWALYATALIQILATPVLGITLVLLAVERALGIGIFDPTLGGDPVLFQHFFWFYSHPAVYIMILPAMGVISELIPVFCRKHIFGYSFIAYSSIAIAAFGFIVWGHHMFTSGQSELMNAVFSLLTFSVSIPSAIKVFNWLATMYKGSISFETPMLYSLAFIVTFTIGGLTGLPLATLATDIHLHDTYFVVAHFHYTMFGGAIIAFLAALHYWWPKFSGNRYSEGSAQLGFWLVFIGFNVTFFTQFMLGSQGMPRRYFNYVDDYQIYHQISTIGSYIMAAGFFVHAYCLLQSWFAGKPAPRNPWGANTLEWRTTSPPPMYNFHGPIPKQGDPYDYSNWEYNKEIDGWVEKQTT